LRFQISDSIFDLYPMDDDMEYRSRRRPRWEIFNNKNWYSQPLALWLL